MSKVQFSKGQKLTLEVTVIDPNEADMLIGWLYHEVSKIDKKQLGCEISNIGFGHKFRTLQRLESVFINMSNLLNADDWIDHTDKEIKELITENQGNYLNGQ